MNTARRLAFIAIAAFVSACGGLQTPAPAPAPAAMAAAPAPAPVTAVAVPAPPPPPPILPYDEAVLSAATALLKKALFALSRDRLTP